MGDATNLKRPLLVVAHPGHELRVFGWLESARPIVCILTDGSGRTTNSRLDSTTRVLEATGALKGNIYGRFTDQDLYNAVLGFEHSLFAEVLDDLVEELINNEVIFVAGDAEEGYNPAHDICRLLINAAVRVVKTKAQRQIANYDFTLVGSPTRGADDSAESISLNLNDETFGRKLSAAQHYPELQNEVELALQGFDTVNFRRNPDVVQRAQSSFGVTAMNDFRTECLRAVATSDTNASRSTADVPFYELYGEKQVKAGHYKNVLRYREHLLPLVKSLNSHLERNS